MENPLIKAMAFDGNALVLFVNSTELLGTVCHRPSIRSRRLRHALGLTVTAASLLAGTLKDPQRLSLSVKLSQPGCTLRADADWRGHVRGCASDELLNMPAERLDSQTIPQLVGDRGVLRIVKDVGLFRSVTGITDMPFGNIVDDLSHYFHQSEQTPTVFVMHIGFGGDGRIETGVGALAQLLPGAPGGLLGDIRETLEQLPGLPPSLLQGEAFRQVPFLLFDDIEIKDVLSVKARCDCSRDMMLPMLYSLGIGELTAACENGAPIEVVCHLCGHSYLFEPDEIKKLFR